MIAPLHDPARDWQNVSVQHGIRWELLRWPRANVAYHWAMSRIHPECPDSDPDRAVLAGILQRQEPDDEDDEEEDQGGGKEDDEDKEDEDDEGYSP